MKINVIKRSGKSEPLAIEKWQAQVAKICSGIADISQSMIEIKAQPHFYDGITTREIDEITLRAVVNLIDVEHNIDVGHTNYQYVAGKQAYAKKLQEKADLLAQFATAEADTSLTQADKDELAKSKAALLDTFDKLSKTSKSMYEMALTVRDLACTVGI